MNKNNKNEWSPRFSWLILLPLLMAYSQSAPTAPPAPKSAESKPATTMSAKLAEAPKLAAAAAKPAKTKPAGQQRLVFAASTLPASLDPIAFHSALPFNDTMYDALTRFDAKGQLQPCLGTFWKLLNDKTWQFSLRQGVKFHDGEPFAAKSVKFTLERVMDPAVKSVLAVRIRSVAKVEIVDDRTVNIITHHPDPILPSSLSDVPIVPQGYYQRVGPEQFAKKPVGSGPFRVVSWEPGVQLTLASNQDSWRKPQFINELQWLVVPEAVTRGAAVRTGAAHMTYDLPPDMIPRLKQEVDVQFVPSARTHLVNLNALWDTPLKDRRVRQALNYAVDKNAIVKDLMGGFGRVTDGQLIGPEAFGYNPALKPYPYDPAKAKQLLQEAGYGNGFTIQMNATSGGYYNDKNNAEAIMGYLQAVGVKVDLKINETAVHIQLRYNNKQAPMFYHQWIYLPTMDADQVYTWFRSDYSSTTYKNPEFDRLLSLARSEMDRSKREKLLHEVAALFREEAPVIFLLQPPDVYATAKGVTGFTPRSDAWIDWDKVAIR